VTPFKFLRRLARFFDLKEWLDTFAYNKYDGDEGTEYAMRCPGCDKDEKLWVNVEKRVATCYYCHRGFDVVGLVQFLENCEGDLPKTVSVLKNHVHLERGKFKREIQRAIQEADAPIEDWKRTKLKAIPLPEHFKAACDNKKLPPYFAERGITRKRAIQFDLGWCDVGFYRNRLIVPVVQNGKLVTCHTRWMEKVPPDGVKKVRYPKGAKTNRMLFNYDKAKKCTRLVLCEDVFSAMAVGKNAVGTFGTHLSKYQLAMLLASSAREIVVMWDRDATVRHVTSDAKCKKRRKGKRCPDCHRYETTWAMADALSEYWRVRVVQLPDDKDPDEYVGKRGRRRLRKLIRSAPFVQPAARFAHDIRARLAA